MSASHNKTPNIVSHPNLQDATEEFFFVVDAERHVRGSTVRDVHACAGARALQDIKGVKDAWITKCRTFILFEDGTMLRYQNPQNLERAVRVFDGLAGLFPAGEYVLQPIPPASRMGTRKKYMNYGKNAANRKNPQRKRLHSYTFR